MLTKLVLRLSCALAVFILCANSTFILYSEDDPLPPAVMETAAPGLASAPHPVLADVRVRRAIAFCTDRQSLIAVAYPHLSVPEQNSLFSDSFIAKEHWLHQSPPLTYTYNFSPTVGQQLLEEAGWVLAPGATYRTNTAGYELAVKFTTTNSALRLAWASEFEKQLRDNCGVHLVRFHWPASIWFGPDSGLFRRDFELGAYAWSNNNHLPLGIFQYGCDFIPSASNAWQGQNYSGWCNPIATSALREASTALLKQNLFDLYSLAQTEFAKDAAVLPLFNRPSLIAANKNLIGLQTGPGEAVYDWNIYDWAISNTQTITLGILAHEPLFTPLSASSANLGVGTGLITSLIYGRGITSFNHDFQALLYEAVPTLENGDALTQTVTVSEGETVVGADGARRTLALGDQVINANGTVVTYSGGTLSMTQIIVTGAFLPNIHWPDGQPLVLADLELWDSVHCDPSAGVYAERCTWIQSREYLNNRTARYTLYPGYASPLYSTFLPNAYPSHRVVSGGRTLGDVPPSEWWGLPEITEKPMGLGPYQLATWQNNGERMLFTANPYFALGQPQTPNLEIRFFSNNSQAIVELLGGEVDVIGEDLIGYGAELTAVINAAHSGLIQAFVYQGPTWEHIDLNQDLFTTIAIKTLPSTGGVVTTALGLRVDFPSDVLIDSTTLVFNHLRDPGMPLPNSDDHPLRSFTLEATNRIGQPLVDLPSPITLTIGYDESELMSADKSNGWTLTPARLQLAVLDWTQKAWLNVAPCSSCGTGLAPHQFLAHITRLGEFVLFGNNRVYLPYLSNEASPP